MMTVELINHVNPLPTNFSSFLIISDVHLDEGRGWYHPELLARILTHVFPDYQQVQEHTTN